VNVRVWDVDPGYLNRQSLLGEHREIHGLLSIVIHDKKGYAQHPETLRWKNHLAALKHRHDLVVSEMRLRGYRHHSPVTIGGALIWPDRFVDPPGEQFAILKGKYLNREPGRIPLPQTAQQLWAQHKYSALARDPGYYRSTGQRLARSGDSVPIDHLALELVALLRKRVPEGRLINALQHLWGHVSQFAQTPHPGVHTDPESLIASIRELSVKHNVTYLTESTALSDLHAWIAAPLAGQEPRENDTERNSPCVLSSPAVQD
jgi:hypothetical protein